MRRAVLLLWGVLAVVVAFWLSIVEVLWLPLRVGGVLVPVSIAAAVVGNLVLVFLFRRLSGSRAVAVLPAVVWVLVAFAASQPRAEGDLLILGGGATGRVNLAFLLLGILSAVFAVARVVGGPRRRGRSPSRDDVQAGASR